MPGEEIAFTARPKINSHSQIFRYGQSIFCLPHRPKISDFFYLCLHWVSIVRGPYNIAGLILKEISLIDPLVYYYMSRGGYKIVNLGQVRFYKLCFETKMTKVYSRNLLMKSSKDNFIFLLVFHLIMCLMIAPKYFGKIAILKI